MKYLVYLNNKDNDSIVKQSFLMSKNLHLINNSRFYSNFINLKEHERIRRYTSYMKEQYISFWRYSLEHSSKLEFYKVFKDEYSTSDYLQQLRNFNERRNLVKFKL